MNIAARIPFVIFLLTVGVRAAAQAVPPADRVLRFGGSEIAQSSDPAFNPSGPYTLEAWVCLAAPSRFGHLVGKSVRPAATDPFELFGFILDEAGTTPSFVQSTGAPGSFRAATAPQPLTPRVWTHLAGTYDGSTLRLFVNGVPVASAPSAGPPSPSSAPLAVGATVSDIFGPFGGFKGGLSNVRMWNRALTAAEIASRMSAPLIGTEPGLAAAWPLDDGQGQTMRDLGPRGIPLQLGTSTADEKFDPLRVRTPYVAAPVFLRTTQNIALRPGPDGAVIDFDGDGDLDIVTADLVGAGTGGLVRAFRNVNGSFVEATSEVIRPAGLTMFLVRAYFVADLTGDGRPDLVLADHGTDADPFPGAQTRLLVGQSDGTLRDETATRLPLVNAFTHGVIGGDIDGDGDIDLYLLNIYGKDLVRPAMYINDGSGHFTADLTRVPEEHTQLNGTRTYLSGVFVDVDGDGDLDLVLGLSELLNIASDTLLLNDGSGHFKQGPSLPPRAGGPDWGTLAIASADLDGNGWPDLVIVANANYRGSVVQLLLNQGGGTFRDASSQLGYSWPVVPIVRSSPLGATDLAWLKWIKIVDINNDGLMDLIPTTGSALPARLLVNNGRAVFTDATDIWDGYGGATVLSGDFDKDGDTDLAFLDELNGSLEIGSNVSTYAASCAAAFSEGGATIGHAGGAASAPVTASSASCGWSAKSDASWLTIVSGVSGTNMGEVGYVAAANTSPVSRSGLLKVGDSTFTILQDGNCTFTVSPLERTFPSSAATASLVVAATPGCAWTASAPVPWIAVTGGASGSGDGTVTLSIAANPSPSSPRSATLIVAGRTVTIAQAPAITARPVGVMDTPLDDTRGVHGAIAVTGWAVDDVGILRVRIERDPVDSEAPGQSVFIGKATRVSGARPDIVAGFGNYPEVKRAGWGYLMLTNMLPNLGNGVFRIHAYADDVDGHSTLLGSKTITCDNATATAPFGAIDTPDQGGSVSGMVTNFGWVLGHGARRADPPHGGTVNVLVDGVNLGSPVAWAARSDLTALFAVAEYSGIANALGVFAFDSTTLTNGLHTIAWIVADDQGGSAGVGSRYFTVANGTGLRAAPMSSLSASWLSVATAEDTPSGAIRSRRGVQPDAPLQTLTPDATGVITIAGEELDRFELHLPAGTTEGHLRTSAGLEPLPIGSHIDIATGVFTWQPGVAFIGGYDFVFATAAGDVRVRIVLHPKATFQETRVVIDTPAAGDTVGSDFVLGGWAFDPNAPSGTGIDAIHVWAYPAAGGTPVFLGAATIDGARPDVGAVHGSQFGRAGYGLAIKRLAPGRYTLAVFAHRARTGQFVPAATRALNVAR